MANKDQEQNYELKTEVVTINRTSLVKRGGRQFSFTAVVVVGDCRSKIGLGIGKAKEVALAIKKAEVDAKKEMVNIHLKKGTIHHPIRSKYGASVVYMAPASPGTGVIAGGAMRSVFDCLGIENILAKRYRSSNPINVARATIKGLMGMESLSQVAKRRQVKKETIVAKEIDNQVSK